MYNKFERLLGRPPTSEEVVELNNLKESLNVRDNDAILDIIIALQYHLILYKDIPVKIQEIIKEANINFGRYTGGKRSNVGDISRDTLLTVAILSIAAIGIIIFYGAMCFYCGMLLNHNPKNFSLLNIFAVPAGYIICVLFFMGGILAVIYGAALLASATKERKGKGIFSISAGFFLVVTSTVCLFLAP
jgi:hypothetical protein